MTKQKTWFVWSRGKAGWMTVDQGSEAEARAGAERRQRSAEKFGMADAEFVALPRGEKP